MSSRAGGVNNGQPVDRPLRTHAQISADCRELLPSAKLSELLNQVAPGEILDQDVEEFLQEHVDEFVDSVTESACRIAKHRKSRTVEARDFQVHLETKWNIRVPGYGDDPRPPTRRNISAPVHNARLQAIAKTQQQTIQQASNNPTQQAPLAHPSQLPQQQAQQQHQVQSTQPNNNPPQNSS